MEKKNLKHFYLDYHNIPQRPVKFGLQTETFER